MAVDPHRPFWYGTDPEAEDCWAVFWGEAEDPYWGPLRLESYAEFIAITLNRHYSLRDEDPDENGLCRICGDYHGEPPGGDDGEAQ